jgi:adenine specific DNA methylase Mod
MGQLFFGDNLEILRRYINDESVDLIYLDPPFNSKRGYNLLFKTPKGHDSDAQITAFKDTWLWGEQAEREFAEILHQTNTEAAEMIQSMRRFLKESDVMAYLTMMANRLLEMHRVLKPTGSIYLHCDPTASHYLKIVLDTVFGAQNFKNEIIWQRSVSKGNVQRKFGAVHDIVLTYAKNLGTETWNQLYQPLNPEYVEKMYRYVEDGTNRRYRLDNLTAPMSRASAGQIYEWKGIRPPQTRCWVYNQEKMQELEQQGRIIYSKNGFPNYKRYLDENPGEKISDVWTDIYIASQSESLGYPTQKPLALLERIIEASSDPGGVVLDPFCGCGTAVHAAQKLGREWLGVDITHLAIGLIEKRMKDAFPGVAFEIHGTPKDMAGARDLALRDKYQFQWWACARVNAQPYQGKKKGADSGIDGLIYFQDEADKGAAKKIIVSVKGGEHVTRTMIADLKNTVEREKAQLGLFVTLTPPTQPMMAEAASAGFYESAHHGAFPRIQILTIDGLLSGAEAPKYPDLSRGAASFKKAKAEGPQAHQPGLL